jgi:hypothetical protein
MPCFAQHIPPQVCSKDAHSCCNTPCSVLLACTFSLLTCTMLAACGLADYLINSTLVHSPPFMTIQLPSKQCCVQAPHRIRAALVQCSAATVQRSYPDNTAKDAVIFSPARLGEDVCQPAPISAVNGQTCHHVHAQQACIRRLQITCHV